MGKNKHKKHARDQTRDRPAVEQVDAQATAAVAPWRDHPLVRLASGLTEIADQPPLIALSVGLAGAGVIARDPRLVRAGLRMLAAHALATAIKSVVKNNVDRARPSRLAKGGDYRMEAGDSDDKELRSFPSGHSAGGVAVTRAYAREYPGAALPAGGAVTALMVALIPKQAHYPSDIVAGAAIGWASEAIIDAAWRRIVPYLPDDAARIATA